MSRTYERLRQRIAGEQLVERPRVLTEADEPAAPVDIRVMRASLRDRRRKRLAAVQKRSVQTDDVGATQDA